MATYSARQLYEIDNFWTGSRMLPDCVAYAKGMSELMYGSTCTRSGSSPGSSWLNNPGSGWVAHWASNSDGALSQMRRGDIGVSTGHAFVCEGPGMASGSYYSGGGGYHVSYTSWDYSSRSASWDYYESHPNVQYRWLHDNSLGTEAAQGGYYVGFLRHGGEPGLPPGPDAGGDDGDWGYETLTDTNSNWREEGYISNIVRQWKSWGYDPILIGTQTKQFYRFWDFTLNNGLGAWSDWSDVNPKTGAHSSSGGSSGGGSSGGSSGIGSSPLQSGKKYTWEDFGIAYSNQQCTDWVKLRAGTPANGASWYKRTYPYDYNPQVGDIAIWIVDEKYHGTDNTGGWGHVAVVESVSGGTVIVSNGNYRAGGDSHNSIYVCPVTSVSGCGRFDGYCHAGGSLQAI